MAVTSWEEAFEEEKEDTTSRPQSGSTVSLTVNGEQHEVEDITISGNLQGLYNDGQRVTMFENGQRYEGRIRFSSNND